MDAIVALERSARAALPAIEEIKAGDWIVRISGGATKRVNSANPVIAGARIDGVIACSEAAYRARSLPPRFRLTPLADSSADATLDARGYARVDDSWTMAALNTGHAVDPAVMLAPRAGERWCAAYALVSRWSAADDCAYRPLLAKAERLAVATIEESGRPVGFGIASIAGGRSWLFNIATHADVRGRGVGRQIVGSLLGWAAAEGVGETLLQVLADNAPARALYGSLGFADAYPYHYRIAGSGE